VQQVVYSPEMLGIVIFWCAHLFFIARGTDSIRWLETVSAPLLNNNRTGLTDWAYSKAHGFGPTRTLLKTASLATRL
jgi:cytosine/uracil/thiamine/allantoin permease